MPLAGTACRRQVVLKRTSMERSARCKESIKFFAFGELFPDMPCIKRVYKGRLASFYFAAGMNAVLLALLKLRKKLSIVRIGC